MREQEILLELLQEKAKRQDEQKIFYKYFQPESALSIDNYPKHFEFFSNGLTASQRLLIAANRIGKTEAASFEITCHAIGWYPSWWTGRKYKPGQDLLIWAAGDTNKTIRDILQVKLLGSTQLSKAGTGIIPKKYIEQITRGGGVAELVDTIFIKRIGGGTTQIQLKSYLGGRETFQGTEVDIIWLDEEPPQEVYVECLLRTLTNKGQIIMTFTPLRGMTPLITDFFKASEEMPEDVKITMATWDDVPHLDEKEKAKLLASIPEWQRDARTKGVPQLGSGAIYRVALDDILVDNFEIPAHWKKAYALDVGWNTTACIWGAINPDNGVVYLYDEMYVNQKQPYEYARTIKMRGEWIEGVVDSASNNSNQHDGAKIFDMLVAEGLKLSYPDKAVEAGIYKCWEALTNGKIKVFKSCKSFQDEYKLYQRDEKGRVVKTKDHLMDAFRYLLMGGMDKAKSLQDIEKPKKHTRVGASSNSWMG